MQEPERCRCAYSHLFLPSSCCSPFTSTHARGLFTIFEPHKQTLVALLIHRYYPYCEVYDIRVAMALDGYKRVAFAAIFERKRTQERDKPRHSQEQNPGRAHRISNTAREQEEPEEVAQMNAPLCAADVRKKEKQMRSSPERERLKAPEAWNTEQQRIRTEERKRLKKSRKQRRRRERKQQSRKELQTKPAEGPACVVNVQKESTALDFSQRHHVAEQVTEVDEDWKYDLAVKSGWDATPAPNEGGSFDSASEDNLSPQMIGKKNQPDVLQVVHSPLQRSPPSEYQPRTPTYSPPIEEPMTPTRPAKTPDVLMVTPSKRCPSPQLEFIVSPKSPAIHQAAANMLVTLKSRNERLNSQIAGFNTHLLALQRKPPSPSKVKPADSAAKAKVLRKITDAMEKHSNQVFMMEFALRDLVDEGDEDLNESLRKTRAELAELVRAYEGKMHKLMMKLSPEAVEKTLKEVGVRLDGFVQEDYVV
jgi:hypothetical protein